MPSLRGCEKEARKKTPLDGGVGQYPRVNGVQPWVNKKKNAPLKGVRAASMYFILLFRYFMSY